MGKPFVLEVGINGNLTLGNLLLAKMKMAATCVDGPWWVRERSGPVPHGEELEGLKYWADPDGVEGVKAWVIPEMWASMEAGDYVKTL